jgi:hypothetical protein
MPRQLQNRVLDLIEECLGAPLERESCPDWLRRPGREELGDLWGGISACYSALTTPELPDQMPIRERRSLDAVMRHGDGQFRVVEVDEVQHFSPPRALTFSHYPVATRVAYDQSTWQKRSSSATKLRGGGWGRPTPPLFPFEGGRHYQRAFRDMLADVLPPTRGWAPTLRIGDFEVQDWLGDNDATERMASLLRAKLKV